jgi:broad-specificity NMP kinase
VDEQGWSLLAANAAVAAKLRQLQPRLEDRLRDRGWQVSAIRIKVQSS